MRSFIELSADEQREAYEAMRSEMFFGEPPSFDDVLTTVRQFETTVNRV